MKKINLEEFPTSESAKKMLSYVSDGFYDESYVGKWIFQVMGEEYDQTLEIAMDLPAQFYPETATWGLTYHEIKWGLPVQQNLSYEERRRLIFQKRDYRAPMTPYHMEEYLRNVTDFDVRVCDVHDLGEYGLVFSHPNRFWVICMGEGTLNSKIMHRFLNRIKQSHTVYTLNDRVVIDMDNRELEKMVLRHIFIRIGISFWRCHVLDGCWLLDSSVKLNARRRYDLVLRLRNIWILPKLMEKVKNPSIMTACKIEGEERISEITQGNRLVCDILNEIAETAVDLYYDLNNVREEFGEGLVTIRRNLWCLDGSISLDGSRIINATIKKENL